MVNLADARPDAVRARAIKNQMDLRVIESIAYLLGQAESTMATQYAATRAMLDDARAQVVDKRLNLRGTLYAFHSRLGDAMRRGDAHDVHTTLTQLTSLRVSASRVQISALGSDGFTDAESTTFLKTVASDYDSTYSRAFDAASPSGEEASAMSVMIEEVLQRIQQEDPETFGEIGAYVSDIVPIRSAHINAGTCFKAFGLLYLTVLREGQGWTTYLENIVHEAAHHHLFAVWTSDQVIRSDGSRMYPSPLRTEPRPMSGIFHAMFVLARTIRIISIFRSIPAYEREILGMATGYNQAKNSASLEDKFAATYDTIRRNAELTEVGEGLLEGCRKMVLEYSHQHTLLCE